MTRWHIITGAPENPMSNWRYCPKTGMVMREEMECHDENEVDEPKLSKTALRDKCDKIEGLLRCLQFIIDNEDFRLYKGAPHSYLIENIFEEIEILEQGIHDL